jgi:hypothetical protein
MSLMRCRHNGAKLPDAHTCALLCPSFPSCLPSPSPALLARITDAVEDQDQQHHEAILDALTELRDAIAEGVRRRS